MPKQGIMMFREIDKQKILPNNKREKHFKIFWGKLLANQDSLLASIKLLVNYEINYLNFHSTPKSIAMNSRTLIISIK